ncbi:MAG: hypothetical protein JSS20_21955, partial [Proteobacteria bacterium]|nr:hypothetical protein [Pseudomonadota bacterium]
REDVVKAIRIMGRLAQPANAVDDLIAAGFERSQAHRIVAFFPTALARPVLEELGITEFVEKASTTSDGGKEVTFDLAHQPEYVAALLAGRDHRKTGCLPREETKAIISCSSDIDAVSSALNEGADVKGGTIASVFCDSTLAEHVFR